MSDERGVDSEPARPHYLPLKQEALEETPPDTKQVLEVAALRIVNRWVGGGVLDLQALDFIPVRQGHLKRVLPPHHLTAPLMDAWIFTLP